jgi:regulation of enolase protein 1 (concanavalin A-like superfamily)
LSGVFTGKGSGADIWGTSDQFNYICQTQTGDFAITARVASQQNTDPWAKAGVMIRESTNANSAYVGVYVTPNSSHGVSLQYRAGTGASALDAVQVSGPTVPYWVRLVRSGNAFSGYYSADGVSWTQAGTNVTVATGATVNAGLAVCSHSTGVLNTSTFDNVSIDYPDFDVVAMPDALGVNGNASAVYTISLSNRFGFSGSVNLSMNGLPPGATASFSLPAISGAATSMLTVTTTNVTASDNYSLDILGTNGTLVSDAVVTLVVTNSIDTDADGVPDWWSQLYFGHATGSAIDLTRGGDDFDGDIMSNAAEYLCGTDPADATSYLHILSAVPQSGDELVTWSAVGGISYVLQSATNFGVPNSFIDVSPVVTPDDDGPASYIDPGAATNAGARFYRVRLGP